MNYELIDELLGRPGKMLSGFKQAAPERRVVWNGNVILEEKQGWFRKNLTKIWFGDISLTESAEALQKLADEFDGTIYVLREMDARFPNEESPRIEYAVAMAIPGEKEIIYQD